MHPFNNSDGTIKRHDNDTVKIDDTISKNDSDSIFEIIATLMKSKSKLNQAINQTEYATPRQNSTENSQTKTHKHINKM